MMGCHQTVTYHDANSIAWHVSCFSFQEMHTFDYQCCKLKKVFIHSLFTPVMKKTISTCIDIDDGIHDELEVLLLLWSANTYIWWQETYIVDGITNSPKYDWNGLFLFKWCYVRLVKKHNKIEDVIIHNHQQLSTRVFNVFSSVPMCTNYIISHHTTDM